MDGTGVPGLLALWPAWLMLLAWLCNSRRLDKEAFISPQGTRSAVSQSPVRSAVRHC